MSATITLPATFPRRREGATILHSLRRPFLALLAGTLLALTAAVVVLAQSGSPNDKIRTGETVVVGASETVDHDLYLVGNEVTVSGTVNGDVVLGATQATIDGTVNGDILGASATLAINGTVHGDVRVVVGELSIRGTVDEDTAAFANSIRLVSEGRIGQDLLFSAGDVRLDGAIGGGITGSATTYERNGNVGGTETVTEAPQETAENRTLNLALDALKQYIVVLLFGVVGLLLAPGGMRAAETAVRRRLLQSLLVGLFVLIGIVLAVAGILVLMLLLGVAFGRLEFDSLLGIDVVGGLLAIGGILFALVVFVAFIGDAIVGLALGHLISAPEGRLNEILRLAVGSAIVVLVTSFPEIGGIAKLLVALVALGAVAMVVNERRQRPAVGPPVGVAPPADLSAS